MSLAVDSARCVELAQAAIESLAERMKKSQRLQNQYKRIMSRLDAAERKKNEAESRMLEEQRALAAFFGVSKKATAEELTTIARALRSAMKGR
jgi:hypothetical protein